MVETWVLVAEICTVILIIIFIVLFVMFERKKKRQENAWYEELMKKLPDVDYTKIVSSSNGVESGNGIFSSLPKTKFLVVYKSGDKQIVNLRDNVPLFEEYVRLLIN